MVLLACLVSGGCASLGTAPEGVSTAVEPAPAAAVDSDPLARAAPAASSASGSGSPAAEIAELDPAIEPVASAPSAPESIDAAPAASEARPATAPGPRSVAATGVPAAPAAKAGEAGIQPTAAAAGMLDFSGLVTRLRKTKAISLLTKMSVKSQSDDLLQEFRAYHTQHGTATLTELRRSYDSLFRTLYSLLEDSDPPLARDIDRSRAAIWEILADPRKFSASNLMAGA